MIGCEIDLTPDDANLPHTHSAVRERHTHNGVSVAAGLPPEKSGTYTIEGSAQRITIVGGRVADVEYEVS
jgi:hypothetical protein